MAINEPAESTTEIESESDRWKAIKAFDESKAGVKGVVDSGVSKIPRFFIHPPENLPFASDENTVHLQIPTIDLHGVHAHRRMEIVDEIRRASETWGFFQAVNHGIPTGVLDEMISAARRFHEQPVAAKRELYSRDRSRKVRFSSNSDLYYARAADWRDTLTCVFDAVDLPGGESLPLVVRDAMLEYKKHIMLLGETLLELISEALGLRSTYLKDLECMKTKIFSCHYYPACPEPDLTVGARKHSDPAFLTILLQDQIGGLQVLQQRCWVDVVPTRGALLINMGDFLQLISNGKLKSVQHRVLAKQVGPRISIACFLHPFTPTDRIYGPIKELITDENPPLYKETSVADYLRYFHSQGLERDRTLDQFKINSRAI